MKKVYISLLLTSFSFFSFGQLTITPNQTATQLANQLVATSGTLGVTVSNAVLTCDTTANGIFTGSSNLGFNTGILLGTGYVNSDVINLNYGLDGIPSDFASQSLLQPGDVDLTAIITVPTFDACVLEFDLQPVGNFVEFEYVFGSEEYPEFNCSAFNDVFAFYISGPGFATPTNIALIPTTTIPVSINSINDGTGGTCSAYTNLYITNNDTTNTMDGFTVPLIATALVTPLQTYHLKLAIADASDMIYNSYVVLKSNSLKSGSTSPNSINDIATEYGLSVFPTRTNQSLFIDNKSGQAWNIQLINIEGQIVYRNSINALHEKSSLNISELPKGMYVLKMTSTTSHDIQTLKIIKE